MQGSIFYVYSIKIVILWIVLFVPDSTLFAQDESDYLSNDPKVCLQCHPKQNPFSTTGKLEKPHGSASNKASPFLQEHPCQTCHGASKKHVQLGGKVGKTPIIFDKNRPAALQNGACLECHAKGVNAARHGYELQFKTLPCASCHGVH